MPQLDQLGDLVTGTLRKLGRLNFNEIVTPYTDYTFSQDLFMSSKRKDQDGGYGLQRNLMVDTQGNAEWTSPYATQTTNVVDVLKTITVNFKTVKTSWALDELEVQANNGAAEKIVDIMQVRRLSSKIDMFNLLERGLLTTNTSELRPNGLMHWIVWHSGASGTFAGGAPSGYTTVGGLSPTTYANWNNWDDTYTDFTEADLYTKWREAFTKTGFRPPVEIPEYGKGVDFAFYTDWTTMNEMIKTTRGQNENLGMEMGKNGTPVFYGTPVRYVPLFEDTTYVNSGSNPIYGVNWKTCHFFSQSGWVMKEHPPMTPSSQPTVRIMYTYCSANMFCNNRRKNFVLAKSQPAV